MPITRETAVAVLRSSHLFQSFSDEQLMLVTQHAKIREVKTGQVLYQQGDQADAFYLIVSGDVTIDRLFRKEQEHVGEYGSGDYFGEEVLAIKAKPRRTTAVVTSDAVLMVFSVPALVTLLHEIPSFYAPLRLAQQSSELLAHKTLAWRNQNEVVHLIMRRHEYFLVRAVFLLLSLFLVALGLTIYYSFYSFDGSWALMLGLIGVCVLSALGLVWQALNWSNDYYIVTNQRVLFLDKVLLLYESRRETPLDAILATMVQTSYLGRWMGFGDVIVRTFTGMVTFKDIASPELVLNLINQHWMRVKNVVAHEDKAEIEATIRRRLQPQNFKSRDAAGHLVDAEPEEIKSGVLNSTMASMFQLRIESEDSITYRKHWFILLRRTWLLSLLIIGCIVLLILRLAGTLPFLDVYAVLGIWLIVMF
ncbi:MAG TPA: cyclic nucleotide-binding domain-containing protein, partial [Longilinea sp.]|nr:cyclic nucleotide-binding domain-containing protein [Longilinea sp.]